MRAWGSGFEKEENGPSGADPLGPALCLFWLVTSLPFLLLIYSFQDYLQPWFVQAPNPFLFFFSLTPYPHFLSEGQCYIRHCLLKLQPRFIGLLNEGRIITVSHGQDLADDDRTEMFRG